MKTLFRLVAVCVCVAGTGPGLAQSSWSYSLSPSVWGAGLNGDVQVGPLTDEIRVNFSDTFGLTNIGGVVSFDANNGRIGVELEAAVVNVDDGADPPDLFHETADVSIDHRVYHLSGTYRMRDAGPALDVVFGVRYFDVDSDILITSDIRPARGASTSQTWADAFIGVRARHEFENRLWVNGRFDAGSGESKLSYQLALGAGYRFSKSAGLTFGYKLLSADYDTDALAYSSVKLSGPYAGLQFGW